MDSALSEPPACELGYPRDQLERLLDAQQLARLDHWMRGQTVGVCDGRRYDHEARQYQDTGCGPHGACVYCWDLERWLRGEPIID
jgi:hypothetical protein